MDDNQELNKILKRIEELKKDEVHIYRNRKSDILFITGCTSSKSKDDGTIPAYCRYTGAASKQILSFFKDNSAPLKKNRFFDLYIMSAGYGFIPADSEISYYDVTFARTKEQPWMNSDARKKMAEKLQLSQNFEEILKQGYKLIILRLGKDYIQALNSMAPPGGYNVPEGTKVCYFKPKSTQEILLQGAVLPIKVCASNLRKYGNNISYQDVFWSEFFKKHQLESVESIGKSIIDKIEDLIK